ncbi:MAG: branched-chain amino acid ABC transporter permease [Clostridiales bacterium]|nr:branched-chain amino acid ABC transporter permease [Clostridiales bacterium]
MVIQNLINALSVGSVYALLAIGYNMVYGILEKLNFAHGDVYAVGCFVTYALILTATNPFIAIFTGLVVGFLLNLGVERFAYRPLRKAGRIAPTISAVGIAYIMRNAIQLIWGPETFSFDLKIFKLSHFKVGNTQIGTLQIYILAISIGLMILLSLALKYTKWGQAIVCISQSIPTSELMGIPANRVIALVYGFGATLGVIGGLLFCTYYQMIYIGIGFAYGTMKAWMASIWGGIGSLKGSVIGAMALGISEVFVSSYVSSNFRDAFVWLIFIVFILIWPRGMYPAQISEKI